MLKKLRNKKTARKIWIVLALLIIPAFVLWGSGSLSRDRESAYAGRIFGKNITLLEYRDAFDAVKRNAFMQFGEKFSEVQKYLNLEQEAWERLILLHEAKKRRIRVNDAKVVELVRSYPFFQTNGKFDEATYNEILRFAFHSEPRVFEEQTRQNLMLSELLAQVTRDIALNKEEIREEYRKANEEVSIYYIASAPADFTKEIEPAEKDLEDYFAANQLDFKQPLSFNLDYITTESEEKIREVSSRLDKKSDIQKIAKDAGLGVKETGLFGQTDAIPGIGWSPEILNLIMKLKLGQYTPPILADKKYYILRLKERKEPFIPGFEAIKDKVKDALINDRGRKIAQEKIEACLKRLQELYREDPKRTDFPRVAKEFGVKSDSTGNFKYGSYIEGIGASDIFWTSARRLKEDEFSEILGTPTAFYIIKPKSTVPIDEKKFESEQATFSEKLLTQKKQDYFAKFLENLKKKAQ
jgi:hypothetical protein